MQKPPTRPSAALYVALAAAAVAVLLGLHSLAWPFARDQGIEGTTGWMLLQGAVPYRDVWSNSPPGGYVAWAVGFAVLGVEPLAVRMVDLVFIAGTAAGLCVLGTRARGPIAGLVAGSLFAASYYIHGDFWHTAQRDSLMLLPSTCAIVAAQREGRRAAIVAGVLVGAAAMFKPGGAAMFLPVCIVLGRSPRRWIEAAAGAAVMPVVFLVGLFATGAWSGFVEGVFTFNRGYAGHYADASDGRLLTAALSVLKFPAVERPELAIGVAGLFARDRVRWVAVAWLGAAAASVFLQAALYPYHYLPLLPPLALGGALAIFAVPELLSKPRVARNTLAVLAGAGVLLGAPQWVGAVGTSLAKVRGTLDETTYNERFHAAPQYEVIATHIREHSNEGDAIFLWSSDAQLYLLSERRPAHRYGVNFAIVAPWGAKAHRAQIVDDLGSAPPAFVVIRREDFMPWLNGYKGDSAASLRDFPELLGFLQANYHQVAGTHYLLLLERTSF